MTITPLPDVERTQYFTDLVNDAVQHGAAVVNPGGGRVDNTIFYPAVLYPVTPAMRLYSEEQFGPVIPIVPYKEQPLNKAIINDIVRERKSNFLSTDFIL